MVDTEVVELEEDFEEIQLETDDYVDNDPKTKLVRKTWGKATSNFTFRIDEQRIVKQYLRDELAELKPALKLILAIGYASTFKQSDEHYKKYLEKIVNKERSGDDLLSAEQVHALARELVADGYIQNGGARYALRSKAQELLADENTVESEDMEPVAAVDEEPVELIPASRLPYDVFWGTESVSEDEKTRVEQEIVRKLSFRQKQVLDVLELTGGLVESTKSVATYVRRRLEATVGSDSYARAMERLESKGYIETSADGRAALLTERGVELIALSKVYPELLKQESRQKSYASTTLYMLELIMQNVGLEIDDETDVSDLPEKSEWLFAKNSDENVIEWLCDSLKLSYDVVARRLYDIRDIKHFVEIERQGEGANGVGNVRLLRSALQYIHDVRLTERAKYAEVEETEELVEACQHLADELDDELSMLLNNRYQEKSLLNFTSRELRREQEDLTELLHGLKNEYTQRQITEAVEELISGCQILARDTGNKKLAKQLARQHGDVVISEFNSETLRLKHVELAGLFHQLKSEYILARKAT